MAVKNVLEYTREDYLIDEKNKILQSMTRMDIDIKVLERTEPEVVVGKKRLTEKSFREIKSKDMLKSYKEQREGYQKRLDVIDLLLKGK